MKNKYIFLIILLFLLIDFVALSTTAQECIPKLKSMLEIGKLEINKVDKDNGNIELKIPVFVLKEGIAKLKVSSGQSYLNYKNKRYKNKFEKNVNLVTGQSIESLFTLETGNKNNIMLSIFYEITDAPVGYKKEYIKYFKVIKNNDSYVIFDPHGKTELKSKEVNIIKGSENQPGKSNTATINYNINVSGKITIDVRNKGLYGNEVVLWFRNTSQPNNWYHPVVGNTQHVHYDVLDEQGNFNFNLSFSGDLSGYNELIVIAGTNNAATYLPAPADGYQVWGENGYNYYFNESEGIVASINGSNSNITVNQNGEVNYEDGSVLRYMMLSRKFIIELYSGNLPFGIASVPCRVIDLSNNVAGHFVTTFDPIFGSNHYIEIDPQYTDFTTVSHEYGHYINYKMWNDYLIGSSGCSNENGQTVPGKGKVYKEGWAIFYSFAARNYSNRIYSESLEVNYDNTEETAFDTNPRFRRISYTSTDPEIAAFACYLWSLYDSYNNNYESSIYNGDNDDVSGYEMRVFEKMRTPIKDCPSKFNTNFSSGLSTEIQNSVNDVYHFMFDNLYSVPSHKMRSAQIKNFNKNVLSSTQVSFTWAQQSYSGTQGYGNYENGYKLYYKSGSIWQLIATIPLGQNSYVYNSSDIQKEYKLTAYNSSGESSNAKILIISPDPPIISHFTQTPTPICQGSSGYVYVHLEQGSGTLNYSWQKENLPAGAYITPLGSKCRITYPSSASLASKQQDGIMIPTNAVRCTVSNSAGSDSRSTNVSMSSLCDPSGCPTLAFNNGTEKVDENTLLISSLSNPGEDVTDYYLINTNDKILNGNIDFYIHEPEEEHTWFDEIELWELKANHGEFIAVTDEGEFINFKEKQKPFKYILNEKIDVTAELESNDGKTFSFMPGDLLRIENANGKELSTIQTTTTTYATLIAVKPPHSDKIIAGNVFIAKEKGKNPQISSETFGIGGFYLRDNMSTVSKKIGELDENDAVEIIFNNETEIDYFVLTDNLKTVKVEKLELLSSEKGSEDLGSRINQTDETYAELLPGEEIHFRYKTKQNVDKKKKIKHVLKVVGRYEKAEIEGLSIGKEKGDGITSVEEELPKENRLFDNYPNPFNPTTTIKYELKEAVNLTLKVYDSLGRIVKTIEEGIKPAGRYEVSFDGSELSSGMYFYRLQSDKFNFTKKMLMIK